MPLKPLIVRLLHWVVALLVLAAVPSGYRLADTGWPGIGIVNRNTMYEVHAAAGILIIVLILLWSAVRIRSMWQVGSKTSGPATTWIWSVALSHVLLAGLTGTIALLGWIGSFGRMSGGSRFGLSILEAMPRLAAQDVVYLYALHKTLVPYLLALLGLHVFAVLVHVFVLKDGILQSILFRNSNGPSPAPLASVRDGG